MKKTVQDQNISEGNILKYVGLVQGLVKCKYPIISKMDKQSQLVYQINQFHDIYSNIQDKPQLIFEKIHTAPFFYLQDLESFESCKVMSSSKVQIFDCLEVIKTLQYFKHLNYLEKFLIVIYYIISILGELTYQRITLRGRKIGHQEKELGIQDNSILTVFGEIIYNIKNEQLEIQDPKFFLKDKQMLIKMFMHKIFWKKIIKYIWGYFSTLLLYFLISRLYKIIKQKIIKHQEQIKDKLRSIHEVYQDGLKCAICLYNIRSIILKPCKHLCMCHQCYKSIIKKECPICKIAIQDFVEIFVS